MDQRGPRGAGEAIGGGDVAQRLGSHDLTTPTSLAVGGSASNTIYQGSTKQVAVHRIPLRGAYRAKFPVDRFWGESVGAPIGGILAG